MQTAFLIIIAILSSAYALFTKQNKLSLSLFIIALSFVLQIPNLATGFWVDVLSALSLILFLAGAFILVMHKKEKEE
jgi:hypothetical protein